MTKEGYQPIKTKKTTKIIPPNTGSHIRKEKRIAELEKENAELKEKYKWLGSLTKCWFRNAPCRSCDEHDERLKRLGLCYIGQLDKAKAIIRDLLRVTYGEGWNYSLGVKAMAEQFLKDVSE